LSTPKCKKEQLSLKTTADQGLRAGGTGPATFSPLPACPSAIAPTYPQTL